MSSFTPKEREQQKQNVINLMKKIKKIEKQGEKGLYCASCGNIPQVRTNLCGGCMTVHYCSAECQQKHWTSGHNKECKF